VSSVADFARDLHEKHTHAVLRTLEPVDYPSKSQSLTDIRAVLFDVYGTLFNYWKPEFRHENDKQAALLACFAKTISRFAMERFLKEMNPQEAPEKTLMDLYHGLIALKHDLAREKHTEFPEVKIEEIWNMIFLMLKRRGYTISPEFAGIGNAGIENIIMESDFVRCVAYYYNFHSLGRGLYPGVSDALGRLNQDNMLLGIVSNAQFYTPVDLTLFLRDQSAGAIDDATRLFEPDLLFFSYEYGVSKPNPVLFRKLFDALYEFQILPSQVLFVGNDLSADIKPAQDAGMKTAFFTGDKESAFLHDCGGKVFPDISFASWDELPKRIFFHSKTGEPHLKGTD
jgi:putative hydrolase of the HAD superfamily